MTEFLGEWMWAIWTILVESGPYLLVGFSIAGLLKTLIPEEMVFRHLGRDDFRSVAVASLFGVPIPLCSCSVIPTALTLKKSGASKGATTSFLISTPETGVDSIGVTWALMDPLMTLARPLAALFTALGCGSLVNFLVRRGWDDAPPEDLELAQEEDACCHQEPEPEPEPSCGHEHVSKEEPARGPLAILRRSLAYAFGPLLDDLTPWFLLGFLVSGLITVLAPDNFFGEVLPAGWMSMMAMLVIGVPLYICATASTPVAAALVAKGLDPGAALVLLLAGPATNVATILVVRNSLGKRVQAIYLGGIAVFSLALGWLVNLIYALLQTEPKALAGPAHEMGQGTFATASGLALFGFLLWSSWRLRLDQRFGQRLQGWLRPLGLEPFSRLLQGAVVLLLIAGWLSTATTSVQPGETVFVQRFGKMVAQYEEPGLYWHLPWPADRSERLAREEIRASSLGTPAQGPVTPTFLGQSRRLDEAEVVTGDEYLLKITFAVHYRVGQAYSFAFGLSQPAEMMTAFAETALRRMTGSHDLEDLLVAHRPELEAECLAYLQEELQVLDGALQAVAMNLMDIHAPPEVHFSFRDVASSLEDKQRLILEAGTESTRKLADARASAYRAETEAESYRTTLVEQARGETAAFQGMSEASRSQPELTRLRLQLETSGKALKAPRLVLVLGSGIEVVLVAPGQAAKAPLAAPEASLRNLED
ncbi:MAG: hypothetical protein DWQ01_21060 [Planctomycetota bacterium]|nr:MAG: hypothetical protein DWQ01_21060 [Planctomycetota bacterium]